MRYQTLWAGLWLAASFILPTPAIAGRTCEEAAPNVAQTLKATQMAELTLDKLDALPGKLVLIGRAGQDLSKYGLKYSHMGFAIRQPSGWSVIHKLNTCGTAESSLYDQGMVNFFSDTPFKYQVGIWRVKPDVQERLLRALNGKVSKRLHEAKYNMLAYPFSTKYQNSNTWVLEVLAYGLAAEDEVATRADAQDWLKQAGYTPTQLPINAMTRLGARISRANIAFDDHPDDLRWSGKIQTVTVASVITFLGKTPNACLDTRCSELSITLPTNHQNAPNALFPQDASQPWFMGRFIGTYADGRSSANIAVQCSAARDCEFTFENLAPRKTPPEIVLSKDAPSLKVEIPNDTLISAHDAVVADPNLYNNFYEGPLLRPLRPILESVGRLTDCLDISRAADQSLALCKHQAATAQRLVLLMTTTTPTCDQGPFCAYYVIPLDRQKNN